MIKPMIEPTFVIVILGILASVAIPRLAGTKADAEISAAVANLRTLVSDASVYHVTKGSFNPGTAATTWNQITNVPLVGATNGAVGADANAQATANLTVGGKECIGVHLVEKTNTAPAYIKFTKKGAGDSVCTQVQNAAPVKAYLDSAVGTTANAIAIGSNTNIYPTN